MTLRMLPCLAMAGLSLLACGVERSGRASNPVVPSEVDNYVGRGCPMPDCPQPPPEMCQGEPRCIDGRCTILRAEPPPPPG
jgi:hypothetical protein